MSATDGVSFNIPRPKRETRSGLKKRFTFDGKEFTPSSQQKQDQQQPEQQQQQKQRKGDNKSDSKEDKKLKTKRKGKSNEQALAPLDDDADNQGFAEWLRSGDGVDMMRLFVIANSLLVFITMAWPHMQESFSILREFIFGEDEE